MFVLKQIVFEQKKNLFAVDRYFANKTSSGNSNVVFNGVSPTVYRF